MSTLPPYLPSRFLSWKLKKPQPCTIQVHHSLARYLYSNSVSATMYVHVSGQLAVKNWWGFRSGTESPNRQIKTTTKFSRIWYCKDKELKFGHRKFTVDIRTVPFLLCIHLHNDPPIVVYLYLTINGSGGIQLLYT